MKKLRLLCIIFLLYIPIVFGFEDTKVESDYITIIYDDVIVHYKRDVVIKDYYGTKVLNDLNYYYKHK